jgi:histidinol-phosphate aminotransferase
MTRERCSDEVAHGGPDYLELERLGLHAEAVLDFSVSTNPLGPSPKALAAARQADLGRYPDRHAVALRRRLARELRVEVDQLLTGNGGAELIWLAALARLQAGDTALVLEPTFGEYRAASRLAGARVAEWRAGPSDDFQVDLSAVEAALGKVRPRVVWVCNPNNPTGGWLTEVELERLARAASDALLVVDEAFLELAGKRSPAAALLGRHDVLILRSMTKDFGLPGVRLGYALGDEATIRALAARQPPWSVNAAALAAGLASLDEPEHVEAGRQAAMEARAYLEPRLRALGYRCVPSATNFWLVEVTDAAGLRRALLAEGIQVRDCGSFGLPGHIRLGARPLEDCRLLVEALTRLGRPGFE